MLKSKSSLSKNASEFVTSSSLLKIVLESEYPNSRIRNIIMQNMCFISTNKQPIC